MTLWNRRSWFTAERVLLWGICLATVGVALVMDPGSYAIYGPAKGLALSATTLLCIGGLLLEAQERSVRRVGRDRAPSLSWPGYLVASLALLVVLSLLTSIDRRTSLFGSYPEYVGAAPVLFALLLGVAAFAYGTKRPDLKQLASVYAIALAAVVGYAISQRFGVDILELRQTLVTERVRSTLGNPSNLGIFLVGVTPYAVWALRSGRKHPQRVAIAVVVVTAVVALAMTLSRGAWIGAAATVIAWLGLSARGASIAERRTLVHRASVVVVTASAAALLIPGVRSRVLTPWMGMGSSGAWRVSVWREWMSLLAESPLLGFGPGTAGLVAPRHLSAETIAGAGSQQTLGSAHNALLDVATASGVLAMVILVVIVAFGIMRAWRSADGSDGAALPIPELGASLVGMMVALQFHFLTLDSLPMLAVTSGLLFGVTASARATAGSPAARDSREPVPVSIALGLLAVPVALTTVGFASLLSADRAASRGWEALERGDSWSQSSQAFRDAISRAPWEHAYSAAFASASARASVVGGEPAIADEALTVIEGAITAHPLEGVYMRHKGDLLSAKAKLSGARPDYESALEAYEMALALAPHDVRALVGAGTCHYALGQSAEALSYLERAVSVSPGFSPAHTILADVYGTLGQGAYSVEPDR